MMLLEEQRSIYTTTYKDTYKCETKVLPPIKFHQLPGLQLKNVPMLSTRGEFPLIPMGPHRVLEREQSLGPSAGSDVNTEKMLSKKPIVKAPPPRHLVYRPPSGSLKKRRRRRPKTPVIRPTDESTEGICESNSRTVTPEGIQCSTSNIVQQLCRDDLTTFTTTSGRAAEEAHIPFVKPSQPSSTFEGSADKVSFRPQMNEPSPEVWQQVAAEWDCAQSRPRIDKPVEATPVNARPSRLLPRRRVQTDTIERDHKIKELVETGKLSSAFERPCPGYAGFVARSPTGKPLQKANENAKMLTIMKGSYRTLPAGEYQIRENAHRGPMSRTVTLTYPYNPFNKVERRGMGA